MDRALGRHDPFARWWMDAVASLELDPDHRVDVVVGELVPYYTAPAVERLARRLGVPWIADLQDPWALDEMWGYPSAAHRIADRRRMRSALGKAAAVVMNTPEAANRVLDAFPELRSRTVVSITNGFDADDFTGEPSPRTDGVFRIVHSGYLHTDIGLRQLRTGQYRRLLGGMPVPEVEFLTRSHVYLLQAVQRVLERDPSLQDRVEVHLVGAVTPQDEEVAAPFSFVRFYGYRSHAETIELLQTAELLFLPMQNLPPQVRAGLVPGKTYEYMASGTPILAAVPDGDAREMLTAVGTATVCRPAAVDCLADGLEQRIADWRAGVPRPVPDPSVLGRFERRQLTSELATVIRQVAAATRR